MKLKALAIGALLAAATGLPGIANAATWFGQTTGSVNLRADATVNSPKITTLPAYASVRIDGQQNGWYHVYYGGVDGWVSGSYVQTRVANVQPRPFQNRPIFRGDAPRFGYYQKPWWDNQRQAWYDGRRWYRNGVWYNTPNFSFGFGFRG